MPILQDIFYSEAILQWAAMANKKPPPDNEDAGYLAPIMQNSRLCGSRLRLYACFQSPPDRLHDIIFDVRACKLGTATAAMVEQYYCHATYGEAMALADFLTKILTPSCDDAVLQEMQKNVEGGHDFYLLRPFAPHKMRHDSIQLAINALLKAFSLSQQPLSLSIRLEHKQ